MLLDCKAEGPRLAVWAACSAASEKWRHFHLLGSLCWNPFLFLIRHLEALFTRYHVPSFCSQFIASSPWGTWCLEGPETCVNKAEKQWDGVKTTLFCMQENIALSDASSFFHPCCRPGLFHQTFWLWSPWGSRMRCMEMCAWQGGEGLWRRGQLAASSPGPGSCVELWQHSHGRPRLPHRAPARPPGCWLEKAMPPSSLEQRVERQEFFLLLFRLQFLMIWLLLGKMCLFSKLFSLISSCLGFSWWRWMRWHMCTELLPGRGSFSAYLSWQLYWLCCKSFWQDLVPRW